MKRAFDKYIDIAYDLIYRDITRLLNNLHKALFINTEALRNQYDHKDSYMFHVEHDQRAAIHMYSHIWNQVNVVHVRNIG